MSYVRCTKSVGDHFDRIMARMARYPARSDGHDRHHPSVHVDNPRSYRQNHPRVGRDERVRALTLLVAQGGAGSLSLPIECLTALIMTLPRMVTQALSARYGDDNLRLVYPPEVVRIESSPDPNTFIMTLATPDGFVVSFSLRGQQLNALSESGLEA